MAIRQSWRLLVLGLALLPGAPVAAASPAAAPEAGDLYQAMTVVTGTDMRMRPIGFTRCLREVLVKVSGEPRLQDDPRLADLAAHADRLVASFDYVDQMAGILKKDDQGSYDRSYNLTVHFDPAKIDAALAGVGETPWRGARPIVVPVLAVRGFKSPPAPPYLLSAEEPAAADQRGSLANAAVTYGLPLRVPTAAELERWGIAPGRFPSPAAAADPNEAIVAGTLEFDPARPGWVGSWRMRWHDSDYAWTISGVNFDKAFDDLMRGALRIVSGHGAPD